MASSHHCRWPAGCAGGWLGSHELSNQLRVLPANLFPTSLLLEWFFPDTDQGSQTLTNQKSAPFPDFRSSMQDSFIDHLLCAGTVMGARNTK